MKKRVVVTGIGVVSPLGCDNESFCERLLEGISGASPISVFDASGLTTRIAAEVHGFTGEISADRKTSFAIAASKFAFLDALKSGKPLHRFYDEFGAKYGVSMGMGLDLFSVPNMIEYLKKEADCSPNALHDIAIQYPSENAVRQIAREYSVNTPPMTHISACAASTDAIGSAFHWIRDGKVSWMLAGGADSMLNPLGVAGFCKLRAMTERNDDPKRASRPFDRARDGFLMGEGGAALVLEEMEMAVKRGARIYGEILGYGNSFDAYGISEPHPQGEGAQSAMLRALRDASLAPKEVGHISAHGTSTLKNDSVETKAIHQVFGEHAKNLTVNATKSMIGHLIAASGAIELAGLFLCGRKGWLHPTINLENPSSDCDLNYCRSPQRIVSKIALKNSFAFGGQNAVLAVAMNIKES
jgi:3-oxoacyl-[acyl-carrier-protein] synthase II